FNTPAPGPGDTVETSLHFFTDMTSVATGYVQIQIGTLQHPEDRVILNLTGTTDPTLDVNEAGYLNSYYLAQNYPNPFNPATKISYKIDEPGFVQLKVYNVLGVEVKSLINEFKNSGEYSINFDASSLYSGVYFYTLSVNNFTQTRKMILEK
ncbi:MAG: T9SS type A sorting domain-containing protein, partial [Ignavibacteriaceae bacterium]